MPTIQRAGDAVAFLAKLIKLANSNIQFDSKVGNFLSLLSWELGLEKAILMFLNREKKELVPHIRPGEDILIPTEPLNFNQTFFERAISNRQSLLAEARDLESLSDKWREFFTPFLPCLAVVPIVDDKTCYGTLIILSSSSKELDSGLYGQMVESVANQLSVTIKHNQLATDTRKRISVLNVLSDLGKSLAQTIEVEKVMSMIPQIAAGVFIADGCALNVLDENGLTLLYSSIYGLVPPAYNYMRYQGQTLPLSVALA
ncbi:MAG: hypothetical protein LBV23_06235, partial [Deltaproteobacteria bacterium]|nr:hypothetical protein [Deltaproteobacteria bacterium]